MMRDGWLIADSPPMDYLSWAHSTSALFALPEWCNALATVGATPKFAWNASRRYGTALACFHRAGFRVGVLGFPVADEFWSRLSPPEFHDVTRQIGRLAGLDLLRVNLSMQARHDPAAVASRPEAWIDDLTNWQPIVSRRLRKDIAYARRANPKLKIIDHCSNSSMWYEIYAATIARRHARQRYTEKYFDRLADIAGQSTFLRIFTALDEGNETRGFGVLARHGSVGYYLHGSADAKGRREGVTDLILESLVSAARAAGCKRLSLMASPWEQPGLLRFKQKWSTHVGFATTYDIAVSAVGLIGRSLSLWSTRVDRRASKDWKNASDNPGTSS